MGCVTSKVLTRTGSFREEISRSLKRRQGVFPALQELLGTGSKKGGDPILVLYNADDTSFESSTDDNIKQTGDPETVDAWDLMEGLDEPSHQLDEEEEGQREHGPADMTKQSQNPRLSLSDHKSSSVINELGESSADTGVRSKSFHTVEEYDAIIKERNGWSTGKLKKEWEDGLADYLKTINKVLNPNSSSVVTPKRSETDAGDGNVSGCRNDVLENHEKGMRRKAMAKDLASLAIPSSTIEFPVIAAEDNVLQADPYLDQNYYVTPKFGSFGLPLSSLRKANLSPEEIQDASVFYPEMLSALEVAMEQLQNEEDLLLKQMGSLLEENN